MRSGCAPAGRLSHPPCSALVYGVPCPLLTGWLPLLCPLPHGLWAGAGEQGAHHALAAPGGGPRAALCLGPAPCSLRGHPAPDGVGLDEYINNYDDLLLG